MGAAAADRPRVENLDLPTAPGQRKRARTADQTATDDDGSPAHLPLLSDLQL